MTALFSWLSADLADNRQSATAVSEVNQQRHVHNNDGIETKNAPFNHENKKNTPDKYENKKMTQVLVYSS